MTRRAGFACIAAALTAVVSFLAAAVADGDPARGLPWPANYVGTDGTTPCCKGNDGGGDWDCTRIPAQLGDTLTLGAVATARFPRGPVAVRVGKIYVSKTPDYVLCIPGCLFRPYLGAGAKPPLGRAPT